METAFIHFVIQALSTAGVFCLFGIFLWLSNRLFYFLVGKKAHAICVGTGIIGTPIHEIGHAFFCILFFHRIDEIKFFQPNSDDGVLGYVNHSYNSRNLYHQIGNFFIGIGPILFGGGMLIFLMRVLIPDVFLEFISESKHLSLSNLLSTTFGGIKVLFHADHFREGLFWLFLILAAFISLHMSLSFADMKTGFAGLICLLVFLFVSDVVLYFVLPGFQNTVSLTCLRIGMFSIFFFAVALAVSVFLNLAFVWMKFKR